jgi:hypothetical protein
MPTGKTFSLAVFSAWITSACSTVRGQSPNWVDSAGDEIAGNTCAGTIEDGYGSLSSAWLLCNKSLGHPVKLDDLPWLISDRIPFLGVGEVLPRGKSAFFHSLARIVKHTPNDRGRNTLSKAGFGLRLSTSVKVSLDTRRNARISGTCY